MCLHSCGPKISEARWTMPLEHIVVLMNKDITHVSDNEFTVPITVMGT